MKRFHLSQEARRAKLERDQVKIDQYQKLTASIFARRDNGEVSLKVFDETTSLLMMNPEFYTVWNIRRETLRGLYDQGKGTENGDDLGNSPSIPLESILETVYVEYLDDDLKLILALLKRFPKCYWIWHHRRWCLFELFDLGKVNWKYEFAVVSKLLELDSRNFHGWQYRRFVVENIERQAVTNVVERKVSPEISSGNSSSIDTEGQDLALLTINVDEFNYTTAKINKDISNFSAWHNRSKLIPKLLKLFHSVADPSLFRDVQTHFQSPTSILMHELALIKTGIYMDSDDTSVWLYLYWLLTDDLFVHDLRQQNQSYIEILQDQLEIVEELNALEKDDHIYNLDNCWCLKTILLLKALIRREKKESQLSDDMKENLQTLMTIDPLRKGKYMDQLEGRSRIVV